MAWNEPGGEKDPWNNSGRGNKPPAGGPPDLEEMLIKLKESVLGALGIKKRAQRPNGGGSGETPSNPFAGVLPIILIFAALWTVFDSFHIISARESGVVTRFGKYQRVLKPGLQITWPRPIETVARIDVTQVRTSGNKVRMLTKDENLIDIDFAVQYTVSDAKAFAFNVRDPDTTLAQVSEAAVREIIGTKTLDQVLIGSRGEISVEVSRIMQGLLGTDYATGIEISAVNLQGVNVPAEVKEAFDDAIRAREKEQQVINEARADAERLVPVAEGQAARLLQSAEGYRDVLIERAKGDASRFQQLVVQYRLAPEIMRRRLYLETIEEILAKTPKVLIDQGDGNNMMYLPLDRMMQGAAPGAAAATNNQPSGAN